MHEYELCIEAMNPCGGSQYARREIMEVETDDPVAYVRQHAMFPILDVAECEDMIIVTTGDGHGYVTRYSFTKEKNAPLGRCAIVINRLQKAHIRAELL